MSSALQHLAKFTIIAALGATLVACGGSDAPKAAAKVAEATGQPVEETKEAMAEAQAQAQAKAQAALQEAAVAEAAEAASAAENAGVAVAAAEPDLAAGEETYGRFCFSCHAAGVAGAPKLGAVEDWAPRIAKGLDMLVASSIEGIPPGMPAKGLCMSCSEDDLRNTIAWMIAQ